jgi:hypothetical protein
LTDIIILNKENKVQYIYSAIMYALVKHYPFVREVKHILGTKQMVYTHSMKYRNSIFN